MYIIIIAELFVHTKVLLKFIFEGRRQNFVLYIYIYIYICMNIHIYVYIYIRIKIIYILLISVVLAFYKKLMVSTHTHDLTINEPQSTLSWKISLTYPGVPSRGTAQNGQIAI